VNQAEQASIYYIGIRAGCIPWQEAVDWAQANREAESDAKHALAVLSTLPAADLHGILWQLMLLKAPVDYFDALRLAKSFIKDSIDSGVIGVQDAAKFTYDYLIERYSDIPSDLGPLYSAYDELTYEFGGENARIGAIDRFIENLAP
jgi:hypothetical protein